jgi:hypothetical protein
MWRPAGRMAAAPEEGGWLPCQRSSMPATLLPHTLPAHRVGPELMNGAVHNCVEEANSLQRASGGALRLEYCQETHQL